MSVAVSKSPPKYRHFKPRNLAVVRIQGRDHYLGEYNSPESWEKYHRILAEFHSGPTRVSPDAQTGFIGVSVIAEAYLNFAKAYYAKNDPKGTESQAIQYALKPLCELFGLTDAGQFGPKSLKLVRERMVAVGWCRRLVNVRINLIKRCFKWAVAEELVSANVLLGLQAVPGLRYGRSEAHETEPIRPVADEHVDATLPFLTPVVQAMVQVQRLTGMRPCEVVIMRPCDIDRSGPIWTFEPMSHKNLWRGHQRVIPLGPKAQHILRPFLERPAEAFLFSPLESETGRRAEQRNNRKTPMTPSQAKRKPKSRPKRTPSHVYDTASYRRAIDYAVKMVNKKRTKDAPAIPKWCPLQLRHTRATEVRKQYGLDGAQSALGHKNANVTQVYAEKNLELATQIARETG